jgi:hypothetical protein
LNPRNSFRQETRDVYSPWVEGGRMAAQERVYASSKREERHNETQQDGGKSNETHNFDSTKQKVNTTPH